MRSALKRIFTMTVCVFLISVILAVSVSADIGPKPSVRIRFEGLPDTPCYGTLISKYESTGPASVWDGDDAHAFHKGNYPHATLDYDTWKAFAEFDDSDGYFFLEQAWDVSDGELAWTYYPPSPFKILLYFPESNLFLVSGVYERYAFDSYFTVTVPTGEITARGGAMDAPAVGAELLSAVKSYDYSAEFLSLFARIVMTVLIEMAVALLFGFREKKELLLLLGVNGVTQIILNVALNLINYRMGYFAFLFYYCILEFFVFVFEAVIYCIFMRRIAKSEKSNARCVGYTLMANTLSFAVGCLISGVIPAIF